MSDQASPPKSTAQADEPDESQQQQLRQQQNQGLQQTRNPSEAELQRMADYLLQRWNRESLRSAHAGQDKPLEAQHQQEGQRQVADLTRADFRRIWAYLREPVNHRRNDSAQHDSMEVQQQQQQQPRQGQHGLQQAPVLSEADVQRVRVILRERILRKEDRNQPAQDEPTQAHEASRAHNAEGARHGVQQTSERQGASRMSVGQPGATVAGNDPTRQVRSGNRGGGGGGGGGDTALAAAPNDGQQSFSWVEDRHGNIEWTAIGLDGLSSVMKKYEALQRNSRYHIYSCQIHKVSPSLARALSTRPQRSTGVLGGRPSDENARYTNGQDRQIARIEREEGPVAASPSADDMNNDRDRAVQGGNSSSSSNSEGLDRQGPRDARSGSHKNWEVPEATSEYEDHVEREAYRDIDGNRYTVQGRTHCALEQDQDVATVGGRAGVVPNGYQFDPKLNKYYAVYEMWPGRRVLHQREEDIARAWEARRLRWGGMPVTRTRGGQKFLSPDFLKLYRQMDRVVGP